MFATASKDNPEPPVGIEGFRTIAAVVRAAIAGTGLLTAFLGVRWEQRRERLLP